MSFIRRSPSVFRLWGSPVRQTPNAVITFTIHYNQQLHAAIIQCIPQQSAYVASKLNYPQVMHELQCGLCMANQHSNVHTVHAKQNINMYIYQRLSERQMDSKINISRQRPQWLSTIDYICFYSFSVFIRFVFARTLTYVQYVAIRMHQQLIGVRTYSIQPDSHYWV